MQDFEILCAKAILGAATLGLVGLIAVGLFAIGVAIYEYVTGR